MKQELLDKYSVAVPRYTSYPPANFFNDSFAVTDYREAIEASNTQQPEHISFYIHIPFCYKMCHYCGCNAMLLENKTVVAAYMDALKREIEMVLPLLDHNRKISQIHYGGGSPTSQPVAMLKEINKMLLEGFETIDRPEIAIECHPGYLDEAYWNDLIDAGFNRISIGIQDFNEDVLKASNRKPSKMPVADIVRLLKSKGVAVNMDFIYGLPLQTADSFADTIKQAIEIQPDRLVTFSYAHVPWVNPAMMNLEKLGLPTPQDKNKIYETAKHLLNDAGYKTVGLDHFVQPNDELYIAQKTKALHRNFQGYCTRRTTGQVYAFGVTGISQLTAAYSQNTKDLKKYIEQVNKGELPVLKGYRLNNDEQITREVITSLMCNYEIVWADLASLLNVSVEEIKNALNYNEDNLKTFAEDGIIEFNSDYIKILPDATPFVRNIAASLDKLMMNTDKRFSKVG
ncbi:oxygen-independent coproporphyrinogen III oxidase [Dysgonomonas sp. GY617]|uniref:oxygen-independent coproporphyrinogen III oxidase n=1 Tax=Dysgonomonas sp. GY617 TaxID=2780420 RepID=UPI001883194E|nr:oxygen-independent coproporphyrinogen III oxidase [Dysgonomonas sp. GY617]MBF0574650.1 oxygen-independent coproporphyrinogen III oxidase [Dysgonomonas sp. GY617]